jgi:hypothetical protein
VANIWKLWNDYGRLTTINNVENRYRSAYTEAVRVCTYLDEEILESKAVLEPPNCMLNNSFVRAVNLIEFNKLNSTISGEVRDTKKDKDNDNSKGNDNGKGNGIDG